MRRFSEVNVNGVEEFLNRANFIKKVEVTIKHSKKLVRFELGTFRLRGLSPAIELHCHLMEEQDYYNIDQNKVLRVLE